MQAPDEDIFGRSAAERLAELPARISTHPLQWAERTPDAEALVDDEVRWTYADLAREVRAAQEWLRELGLRPGDRLMVVNENCRALVTLLLAASELDVWVAIINARLAPNEVDLIRGNCEPRRIVYTLAVSPEAASHAERHGADAIDHPSLGKLAISPLLESTPEPVAADGGQVAAMIYTSGTTGVPKGVMLTHRGCLYIASISGGMRNLNREQRVYGVLPMSHVFGLSSVCLGSLYNGACLYPVPRFEPGALVQALKEEGISVLQGVPAMFARTLEYVSQQGLKLEAPRLIYTSVGGAPLDLDLKRRTEAVLGTTLHNGYGLTEASPTISQTRIGERHDSVTVGRILPLLEYKLLDQNGREVPTGNVGELWVRGPNVMKGYFRNPAATAATLADDGWLNTGDMARLDDERNLYIVARSKELIIRSGFNVYPPDVEAVLNEHPQVTLSAVVGREVPGNEEVVAYVQPVPGAGLTADELRQFAAERLSAYKRPSEIVLMDTLPATATGKILKNKLKAKAQQERQTS
ncbi:long-chain fatty acid--CoA ligase [Alkalilimnicola ehrlichii]|uniref:Long-chain fatty acid--CoA ligase n=1 Tax=Alkalilimnicola ehrlichii TaxID=351052 RepID=A0A3E0X3C9_9GAMM|nr:AMP-binding protein [Alkalilimnicola ehrlichii]RFA31375.1 long-chain fatty acid--CoA ligase [Alkalilimnicola ehrlichii]RFA39350.1 long-chain fatty acid--CoA ligase [Alkalilimnicola ehrlichii]